MSPLRFLNCQSDSYAFVVRCRNWSRFGVAALCCRSMLVLVLQLIHFWCRKWDPSRKKGPQSCWRFQWARLTLEKMEKYPPKRMRRFGAIFPLAYPAHLSWLQCRQFQTKARRLASKLSEKTASGPSLQTKGEEMWRVRVLAWISQTWCLKEIVSALVRASIFSFSRGVRCYTC